MTNEALKVCGTLPIIIRGPGGGGGEMAEEGGRERGGSRRGLQGGVIGRKCHIRRGITTRL